MEAAWLEVSVTVDGELAEAIAEVMARYVPNGVVIESTAVTAPKEGGTGHPVGPLKVRGFLPVDDQLEEKRRQIEEAIWYLGRIRPLPALQYETIQETDWSQAWKERYQPITVGQSLIIIPAWLESSTPGRIPVRIDPGMAFGTGTHPTTQLCLQVIEEELGAQRHKMGDQAALEVIDVGCGSGILSIAALKLGATFALAVDMDVQAVEAARENAILNDVIEDLELGVGSVDEILSGAFSLRQAPIVLANILAFTLIRLLDKGIGELVPPDGKLVLSGILIEQVREVELALNKHSLRLVDRRQLGDWVTLVALQP